MARAGRPIVLGMDAGGTMTDTIVVDEHGAFTVGKALTTPQDETVGFFGSLDNAIGYWDLDQQALFANLELAIYAGTSMLNTLLQRRGTKLGLITTKGLEDDVLKGRGTHTWKSYAYSDRLHAVTHVPPQPLVSRRCVFGVTERVDAFGEAVIPLYEHEVIAATTALLAKGVEAIVIHFLFSYLNDAHELAAERIVKSVLREKGRIDIGVFPGSKVRPVMRENGRLNSALIEAYAAAPSRRHLHNMEEAEKARGYRYDLQTVLAYGGLCNIRYSRLHETLISGPVGGIMGGQYLGELLGEKNIILTDMGGTSFDIGAITDGYIPVDAEPTIAGFTLNLPTLSLESIGAGAGSYIRLDPLTKKIQLGPEGAGASPGPVCFDRGGTTLTITDCNVLLGYVNPDNFLGGQVKLHPALALAAVKEQLADPLGVEPYEAAAAMLEILGIEARDAIRGAAGIRGLDTTEYVLFSYGGAGPVHAFEYTRGIDFKGIATFKFAGAFSALGTTVGDFMRRYSKSVHLYLAPQPAIEAKFAVGKAMNAVWAELEGEAYAEMAQDGVPREQVRLEHLVMMRYAGQLNDLEAVSPVARVSSPADLDAVVAVWEQLYERINRRVSKYEAAGYQVYELGLIARTKKVKPVFERHALKGETPPQFAFKGERRCWFDGRWWDAQLWDMDTLEAGNVVRGPAIVEAPATTLVVPPGGRVRLDEWEFLWLERASAALHEGR
ncbi:MAG: hydantoinase/oxoprolinase family protein [Gammaproteobacteria bacterium]|nr:hydantoinase/oxoprolinase family protein [Gammaproteobacteria bacterium]